LGHDGLVIEMRKYRTCALRSKTRARKHQMHVAADYHPFHGNATDESCRAHLAWCHDGGDQNEETTKADTPREFVIYHRLLLCKVTYELQGADA
jgi:hypothetical protein